MSPFSHSAGPKHRLRRGSAPSSAPTTTYNDPSIRAHRPRLLDPPIRPRPKPRPKPVVPITDAMKSGKEPMRTFADLAQFYEQQAHAAGDGSNDQSAQQEAGPDEPKQPDAPQAG